ncbi:MAG: glycosyltransferase [Solobacterium sp.]|nr:glycosyltransferase [Solobacterium sp.]
MGFEQTINQQLNKYPKIKKGIKRIYQTVNYAVSKKRKYEGNILRVSPEQQSEYFFGYYDKSPEDAAGRYVLCLKAENTWTETAPAEPAEIILIDTAKKTDDPDRVRTIASTHTWNVQQGCMMQWLGPDYKNRIIYNDCRNGKYCSVILDVFSGEERVLSMPVYSVSKDGSFALTLDFSRLHRLRPGYGYSNIEESTKDQKLPDTAAIWKIDLIMDTAEPLLKYTDFSSFEPRKEMEGAEHKVNHIMISPNGKRFMVLHRWLKGERKYTRLVTVNVDGTDMYNLSDDDMVSHCWWQDDETIIAFENKKGSGAGYYRMKDHTQEYRRLWPHISSDGHPSVNPDGRLVVTDTYPDRNRMSVLKVLNEDFNVVIAKVFAPFKYDNDTRCDLHPRWSRDGKKIYFDGVFEGHRGLYAVPLDGIRFAYSDTTGTRFERSGTDRIRIVYVMTSCKKVGPTQQTLNIIKNLDQTVFEPFLITLYDEEPDSRMRDFLPWLSAHYLVKTGKRAILTGQTGALKEKLNELHPDIVHTVGVFPDYAVSRIGKYVQIHTLRNYIYDDYPAKFGKVKGSILAGLQLYAMKNSDKAVACSESLSRIYEDKLGMHFDYIRNGVDVDQYTIADAEEKKELREKLDLPADAFIYIYTGQFIERKNIPFLLKHYVRQFGDDPDAYMVLLGDGDQLSEIKQLYRNNSRLDFRGNVSNVDEYLKASDVYVSASRSEGLPNGVLEAMASGIPVVISDIEQHKEIFEADERIGYLFCLKDGDDLIDKLKMICEPGKASEAGRIAYETAHNCFSAPGMSAKYQEVYRSLVKEDGKNGKNNK